MPPEEELSQRLRDARERAGLTQEQAADAVALPRTAIVKIERGDRAVSSLELVKLARLYGRDVGELLSPGPNENPTEVLFRANPMLEPPELQGPVRQCIALCRELGNLERMMGIPPSGPLKVNYDLPAPHTKREAVQQGQQVAVEERRRLGLGDAPAWELVAVLRRQGIRAAEYPLPHDISALSFAGQDSESIIIVNRGHVVSRRLYSFAHEYAHRLMDRKVASIMRKPDSEKPPMETRADVFAAHLLLPPSGVRAHLASLGKSKGGDIQYHDVVSLAAYYAVHFTTAVYHLHNLSIINAEQRDVLLSDETKARDLSDAMGKSKLDDHAHWDLVDEIIRIGTEAHSKGEITRRKLLELVEEASPGDAPERVRKVEILLGMP